MRRVESVIFCLTRDRPQTLVHTLNALSIDLRKAKTRPRAVVILDDSVSAKCRLRNGDIVMRVAKDLPDMLLYHGPAEQHEGLAVLQKSCGLNESIFKLFFRRLGGLNWDLGGIRSYAMLFANLLGKRYSAIVMLDDDIVILPSARGSSAIVILEQAVLNNPYLLTGGIIKGAPDESTVEAATRMVCNFIGSRKRAFLPEMPMPLSGGFLAFNSGCSRLYPFPRWYNEDWTWLAQYHAQGYRIRPEPRAVAEHIYSRKRLSFATMKREQEGELLFEALNWAIKNYSSRYVGRAIRSVAYWKDVAKHEVLYLNSIVNFISAQQLLFSDGQLKTRRAETDTRQILQLLRRTKTYVGAIKTESIMKRYSLYLEHAKLWRSLTETVNKKKERIGPILDRLHLSFLKKT